MKNSVNTRNFSILKSIILFPINLSKILFLNDEIEDDSKISAEIKRIKKQENISNIVNLESQVTYKDKVRRGRKPKNEYKVENSKLTKKRIEKKETIALDLERE